MIYGSEGAAMLDGQEYIIYDKKGKIIKQAKGSEVVDPTNTVSGSGAALDTAHISNFIETVRGNQQLNCPIEEGSKSVSLLHLGNIAWRIGRELRCDSTTGHILNDAKPGNCGGVTMSQVGNQKFDLSLIQSPPSP